jgi:hypothetical protein
MKWQVCSVKFGLPDTCPSQQGRRTTHLIHVMNLSRGIVLDPGPPILLEGLAYHYHYHWQWILSDLCRDLTVYEGI